MAPGTSLKSVPPFLTYVAYFFLVCVLMWSSHKKFYSMCDKELHIGGTFGNNFLIFSHFSLTLMYIFKFGVCFPCPLLLDTPVLKGANFQLYFWEQIVPSAWKCLFTSVFFFLQYFLLSNSFNVSAHKKFSRLFPTLLQSASKLLRNYSCQ